MKKITIKKIEIENFKGISNLSIDFSNNTTIKGMNALGKTSVFDSLTWLLFDKNSLGESKFQIRPLDSNGNPVDNIEIKVTGTFEVDGTELVLLKVQKQNWVKHRGELEKKFEGNVNSYEVDGFPKAEKEYKKFITELVDEEVFKLITNPQSFPNKAWKEQREILMRFVPEINDIEIASKNEKYAPIIPDLQKAENVDDIKKKYSKARLEYNKQLDMIPARIDEISKMKVDYKIDDLKIEKKRLESEIAEIDLKMKENQEVTVDDLKEKSMRLQMDINALYAKENDSIIYKRRELENQLREKDSIILNATTSIASVNSIIAKDEEIIKQNAKKREELGAEYHKVVDSVFDESLWTFDESSLTCKMCGQKLPKNKQSELKKQFEDNKQKAIYDFNVQKQDKKKALIAEGNGLKAQEEKLQKEIEELKEKVKETHEILRNENPLKERLRIELNKIPEKPDMTKNEKYVELTTEYQKVLQEIQNRLTDDNSNAIRSELLVAKNDLLRQVEEVAVKIQNALNNANIDERIAELENKQSNVAQSIADCERMAYLVDEFIKEKMNLISEAINKHFKVVNFNLFKTYQNGGIEPCCECTVNGIPYSSLNAGHRIVAGLDIINSLCELYEVSAPCFTDNAESINDFNIPNMQCQMVLLKVSDDKELIVEC